MTYNKYGKKKVFIIIIFLIFFLAGCSLPGGEGAAAGRVTDRGDGSKEIADTLDAMTVTQNETVSEDVMQALTEDAVQAVTEDENEGTEDVLSRNEIAEDSVEDPVEDAAEDTGLDSSERERILGEKKLRIKEKTIELAGIEKDMDILFLADSHISLADERDAALMKRASVRYGMMLDANGRPADQTFHEFIDYTGAEQPDLLILGGDITDSALYASVDFVKKELKSTKTPYLMSLGNHDFEYGPEYFSKKAYDVYRPRLLGLSKSKSGAHLLSLGGIYVFAVDDFNNQYTKEELDAFKKINDDGRPILFVSHVPIEPQTGDTTLHEKTLEIFGKDKYGNSKVLIGDASCKPNQYTREMLDLILKDESPVFCVLAGHIHYAHEDMLNNKVVQIISGAAYNSEGVLLHLEKSS